MGRLFLSPPHMGDHEFEVARFYYRYGIPVATVNRLNFLLSAYPEYAAKDKVYSYLGLALNRVGKPEEAGQWCETLRTEFPSSAFVSDIPAERG